MKVIVNNQTTLIIEDEKGNVLFQHLPQQQLETNIVINCDKYIWDKRDLESLSEKLFNKFKESTVRAMRGEKVLPNR